MELVKGQLVFSRRGRDVTTLYAVVGFGKERVLLANGSKWTLAAPKEKNPRHLNPTSTVLPPEDAGDDTRLKAAIAAYMERHGPTEQGG